jgi:hypothetical protein
MKILLIGERGDHFGSKHLLINITSKEDYFHSEVFMIKPNFKKGNFVFLIKVKVFQT